MSFIDIEDGIILLIIDVNDQITFQLIMSPANHIIIVFIQLILLFLFTSVMYFDDLDFVWRAQVMCWKKQKTGLSLKMSL